MKIAYAFCGSFCTHAQSLQALERLVSAGAEVLPIFSECVANTSTRFGRNTDLALRVEALCGCEILRTISEAEDKITRGRLDALVVAPCTGNTLGKIAHAITDGPVTMAVKANLRNRRPTLIALATNDALGATLENIALTIEKKNIYFVPFAQDDPIGKPTSLVCDFRLLPDALDCALRGVQLQPRAGRAPQQGCLSASHGVRSKLQIKRRGRAALRAARPPLAPPGPPA